MGYDQAVRLAIYHFHKTGLPDEARRYLVDLFARSRLSNTVRLDTSEANLDAYLQWHSESGAITADHKVRILLDLGGYLQLSGEVARIDIIESGYRAVLLGATDQQFREQLRMPLLQRAIATTYVRPVELIGVGMQALDGSGLAIRCFSPRQIRAAEAEFTQLGETLRLSVP